MTGSRLICLTCPRSRDGVCGIVLRAYGEMQYGIVHSSSDWQALKRVEFELEDFYNQ